LQYIYLDQTAYAWYKYTDLTVFHVHIYNCDSFIPRFLLKTKTDLTAS